MDTIKIDRGSTLMIAHRGLSGLEPENTIPAFVAAGNRSYFGIETDVRMTEDGFFVIMHDPHTGRTAGNDIKVGASSFDSIRNLSLYNLCGLEKSAGKTADDVGKRKDLIVPTLADYINICKKYDKKCVLELKGAYKEEDLARMVTEIECLGYLDNVIFISFIYENLIIMRKLLPDQPLQYLASLETQALNDLIDKINCYNFDLDIYCNGLTKDAVDLVHANNHKVNCWVCDSSEEAQILISWGVDFITTNILE